LKVFYHLNALLKKRMARVRNREPPKKNEKNLEPGTEAQAHGYPPSRDGKSSKNTAKRERTSRCSPASRILKKNLPKKAWTSLKKRRREKGPVLRVKTIPAGSRCGETGKVAERLASAACDAGCA